MLESTARQDADNQRHEILEYTNRHHLHVDEFIEIEISLRPRTEEGIGNLWEQRSRQSGLRSE